MILKARLWGVLLFLISFAATGQKQISIDDFTTYNTFNAKWVTGINWMTDGKFYTSLVENMILKFNVTTGERVDTIFNAKEFPSLEIGNYSFSGDEKKLLIASEIKNIYRRSFVAEYFVYDIPSKNLRKLSPNGKQSYASFSPDGTRIAFVRNNNIFYVSLADMSEVQVTDDGKFNSIINGTTDWVYEEEFAFVDGFFWSPDGKTIAYYRFNETDVKEYTLQIWGKKSYPAEYKFKYPKAGEANSAVEIWFYNVASRTKTKADLGNEKDFYIPKVKWTQDPEVFAVRKLNRLQNHLELLHVNSRTGESKLVLDEKSDTYIEAKFVDELLYFRDGKHLVTTSEKSGYKHIYIYSTEGKLIQQVTSGDFEVTTLVGADEKTKTIYFISTEDSSLDRHFYAIQFDGKKKQKLTSQEGQHVINLSTDFQFYIDQHSSAKQPNVASLYQTRSNKLIKVIEKNEEIFTRLKEFKIVPKEFFVYENSNGDDIHGYFLKPEKFTSQRRYPVVLYQYSGPGSQNVSNGFGGNHFFFHQFLTQQGFIVAVVDCRGTGAKGAKFKKSTYRQLGKLELEDLVASAKYFSTLPYIDSSRLAIWGWSYGGYMASLAMTKGAGTFKVGMAVSPVTNWRYYNSIYSERYLQTPQLNGPGYDDYAPLTYPENLEGKFLLIHGTGDDNVHFQNTVMFQNALIHAGKQFQSFFYPDKHHAIPGPKSRYHLYTQLYEFLRNNL